MYKYELTITEAKKGEDEKPVVIIRGESRTIKAACQHIRQGTLQYVSKNRKIEEELKKTEEYIKIKEALKE